MKLKRLDKPRFKLVLTDEELTDLQALVINGQRRLRHVHDWTTPIASRRDEFSRNLLELIGRRF